MNLKRYKPVKEGNTILPGDVFFYTDGIHRFWEHWITQRFGAPNSIGEYYNTVGFAPHYRPIRGPVPRGWRLLKHGERIKAGHKFWMRGSVDPRTHSNYWRLQLSSRPNSIGDKYAKCHAVHICKIHET